MYANQLEGRVAKTTVAAGLLVHGHELIPAVDAVATVDPAGKTWVLALVNRHPSKQVACDARMKDALVDATCAATILAGDSPEAYNEIEHPARVVPKKTQVTFQKGVVTLAPHSLSLVKISTKPG